MKQLLLILLLFTTVSIFAQTSLTDDFEGYTTGTFDNQLNDEWRSWSGEYSNAIISNKYAYEGAQSLKVVQNNITSTDIIHQIKTLSDGQKVLSLMQYIPSEGSGGYYNLQNNYSYDAPSWAVEIRVNAVNNTAFIQTGAEKFNFEPILDSWVEQKFIFNFEKNEGQFFYDEALVHTWDLGIDALGQEIEPAINAINFFALNHSQSERHSVAYYDNIEISEGVADASFLMPILAEETNSLHDYIQIAPNPAKTMTQLKLNFPTIQTVEIRIYDQKGQLLKVLSDENIQSNQYTLDLSTYTNGVYFCQIQTNNDMITERIVVSK